MLVSDSVLISGFSACTGNLVIKSCLARLWMSAEDCKQEVDWAHRLHAAAAAEQQGREEPATDVSSSLHVGSMPQHRAAQPLLVNGASNRGPDKFTSSQAPIGTTDLCDTFLPAAACSIMQLIKTEKPRG